MLSKPTQARPELDALLAKARQHVMSAAERYEQRISFVYGQMMGNPRVTKDMVRVAARELYGPPPSDERLAAGIGQVDEQMGWE